MPQHEPAPGGRAPQHAVRVGRSGQCARRREPREDDGGIVIGERVLPKTHPAKRPVVGRALVKLTDTATSWPDSVGTSATTVKADAPWGGAAVPATGSLPPSPSETVRGAGAAAETLEFLGRADEPVTLSHILLHWPRRGTHQLRALPGWTAAARAWRRRRRTAAGSRAALPKRHRSAGGPRRRRRGWRSAVWRGPRRCGAGSRSPAPAPECEGGPC